MKNKLIFRILGALASALIIVSVFIPFVSVTGHSFSLWGSNMETNSIYLPTMIIIFGVIGVIFFSLNIKTEFAYMSAGAITFFLVVQTIDILDQGVFNTLSIGYYCMVVGTFLTGLMAFLVNLRTKQKVSIEVPNQISDQQSVSVLSQIDTLYNNSNELNNVPVIQSMPVQPIDNVIPVQSMEQNIQSMSVQPIDNVVPVQPMGQNIQSTSVQPVDNVIPVQPMGQNIQSMSVQPVENVIPAMPTMEQNVVLEPIPFGENQQVNPILEQFNQPIVNPTIQEFSPEIKQVQPDIPSTQNFVNVEPQVKTQPNFNQQIQGVSQFNQNTSDVDIFGQPINK